MPLLIIHSLPPADPGTIPQLIVDVRDAGARALGCPKSNIWVVFQPIAPGHYVQGEGAPARAPQPDSHPPCIILRAQVGRTQAERSALVSAVAAAVGRGLSVPAENVWVYYEEMRSEDVWFNGRWSA